jgi:autotransporter-associated beta strand protein
MQFAGANITSALPISLQAARGTFDTNGNNATLSGAINGPGSLTKIGAGTLTLAGASTYTGATAVNVGTLQAGAVNAFSPFSAFTVASGATLDLNSFSQTIGSLAGTGSVTLGSGILTTGNDNTSTIFSGPIAGTGGLTKIGAGTLTLAGASTYTGATAGDRNQPSARRQLDTRSWPTPQRKQAQAAQFANASENRNFPNHPSQPFTQPRSDGVGQRPDCVAGVRGLKLRNPCESYVFEMSR